MQSTTSQVTVNVTQKHIDGGTPQSCRFCPIALAINEQLCEPYFIQVGQTKASIYKKLTLTEPPSFFGCHTFDLPVEATRFIKFFDNDNDSLIQPFSFQLEIPTEYLENES